MVVKVVFKFGLFKLIVLLFFLIFGKVILVVLFLLLDVEFFFFEVSCVLLESVWVFLFGKFCVEEGNVFFVLFIIGFVDSIFFFFYFVVYFFFVW